MDIVTSKVSGIPPMSQGNEYPAASLMNQLTRTSPFKARETCEHNKQYVLNHFYLRIDVNRTGNGALHKTEAYRLSRYACYLIILHADKNKPVVALGQAYFAYETRRQEVVALISQSNRPEHLKQDVLRFLLFTYDFDLQKAARETWVAEPEDFALFFNHGFMGLIE